MRPRGEARRWRRAASRASRWIAGAAALAGLALLLTASRRAQLRSPPPTLLLYDADGRYLAESGEGGGAEAFGYWSTEETPVRVREAALALEDRRFWSHPGVDPVGVLRAARQNLQTGERISGASTVAMQIARMQDPGPRTWTRKIVEAATAILLTQRYGREAILDHYLRLLPYGNRIHGANYAARRYLDKPARDLSWAETAFLAAMPQAPSRTNPYSADGRRRAAARASRILDVLASRGLMTPADLERARRELEQIQVPPKGSRPPEAMHAALRISALAEGLRAEGALSAERPLIATLDLELQATAAEIVARRVEGWRWRGAGNGALIVLELPAPGDERTRVRAYVGSTDYFADLGAGAIDFADTPRYPGSTLKPLLYGLALDRGTIGPASILDDLHRGPLGVGNADGLFLGPLLPRRALGNSRNVPAVELLDALGLDEGYAFLRESGLHDGALPASHYGLGMAVGGIPVTLTDLARAYTALATDGRLRELTWIEGQPVAAPRRILSAGAADVVQGWLSDPQARLPSFPRLGYSEYPFPVAVKTGTSGNYRDAWTVAWSDRYLVAAWVGHPDWRPTNGLSGYRVAGLVREVIQALHADRMDGLQDRSFPPPEGYVDVEICALTGGLVGPACDQASREWFSEGEVPQERCRSHLRLEIDRETGRPATPETPPGRRVEATFVDLPARYRGWAASQGLVPPPTARAIEAAPSLSIASPEPDARLVRDPEVPAALATLALRVEVEPPAEQVLWYVDGEPFALVEAPYTARWPIQRGAHRFQARVPFTDYASDVIEVFAE